MSEQRDLSLYGGVPLDDELPPILNGRRVLPRHFAPGHVLTAEDIDQLTHSLNYQYRWLGAYRRMQSHLQARLDRSFAFAQSVTDGLRLQTSGYLVQKGRAIGLYADDWVDRVLELEFTPLIRVERLVVTGWRASFLQESATITCYVDDTKLTEATVGRDRFQFQVKPSEAIVQDFRFRLECSESIVPADTGISDDTRRLSVIVTEMRAIHPRISLLRSKLLS